MVRRVDYEIYEEEDIIERALSLKDDDPDCPGGEWCPRCRLAIAVTELTDEFSLRFDFGDGMLRHLAFGLADKRPWGEEESNDAIGALTPL